MTVVSNMEWRLCPRFPDYEVSECGDLRRRVNAKINQSGRRLKGVINPDGYVAYTVHKVSGSSTSVRAHVMVAEAFIGPRPSELHEVAHNNGSRLLNTPDNLRWALRQENSDDRYDHETDPRGTRNGRATITDDDVRYIRKRYYEIKVARGNVAELDNQFNLHRSQIIRIARRQAWSHVQ